MDSQILNLFLPTKCEDCETMVVDPRKRSHCDAHPTYALKGVFEASERKGDVARSVREFRRRNPERAREQQRRAELRRQLREGLYLPFVLEAHHNHNRVGWWLLKSQTWDAVQIEPHDLRGLAAPFYLPEGLGRTWEDLYEVYYPYLSAVKGLKDFVDQCDERHLFLWGLTPWVEHWVVSAQSLYEKYADSSWPTEPNYWPVWPPRSAREHSTPAAILIEGWAYSFWCGDLPERVRFRVPLAATDIKTTPLIRSGRLRVAGDELVKLDLKNIPV